MPITKNGQGTLVETPVLDKDQWKRTGVIRDDSFAIADGTDKTKQIRFEAVDQTPNKSVTIATGGNVADIVVTLPAVSGTLITSAQAGASFTTIQTPAGTSPVATSITDTLTLAAGAGITITGNSTTDTITIAATGGGDVVGPASATDNAIPVFDGTTGKLLKESGVTVDGSNDVRVPGSIGIGTSNITATARIVSTATDVPVLSIKGAAGQSANLLNINTDDGEGGESAYLSVDYNGFATFGRAATFNANIYGSSYFALSNQNIQIATGNFPDATTGDAYFITGDSGAGDSGNINFHVGTATGTRGKIHANANIKIDAGTLEITDATATTVPYFDASKNLVSSTVTPTTLGYLDATSSVQTQIDAKAAGAASSTDNAVARFDSTTGKVIQNSGVIIDDSNNVTVPGAISSAQTTRSERFGASSSANSTDSVAVGNLATANFTLGVAVGAGADCLNTSAVTIGYDSSADLNCTAVGRGANATGSTSISLGYGSSATTVRALTLGASASATADSGHALGHQAAAGHQATICIGYGATSTAANQLIIGGTSSRSIKDCYIGAGVTDATPDATVTIQPTGGSGTNIVASNLIVASGKGTGSSAVSSILLKTPTVTTTGTSAQALATRVTIDSTGAALANATASTAAVFDANKYVISSATTATELGYVSGVTSAIQTQFTGKQNTPTLLSASFPGTRDTGGAPTVVGHWRSMLRNGGARTFSDTNGTPTFTPDTSSGFRLYNGNTWATIDNTSEPTWYQFYIGSNKNWDVQAYSATSKSGGVQLNPVTIGSAYVGYNIIYDSPAGTLTFVPLTSTAHTSHSSAFNTNGDTVNDVYVDVLYW